MCIALPSGNVPREHGADGYRAATSQVTAQRKRQASPTGNLAGKNDWRLWCLCQQCRPPATARAGRSPGGLRYGDRWRRHAGGRRGAGSVVRAHLPSNFKLQRARAKRAIHLGPSGPHNQRPPEGLALPRQERRQRRHRLLVAAGPRRGGRQGLQAGKAHHARHLLGSHEAEIRRALLPVCDYVACTLETVTQPRVDCLAVSVGGRSS